jgi:hypothetical protein
MSKYAKAIAAIVMAVLTALQTVATAPFTMQTGATIAVAALTAVGVYLVPVLPGIYEWPKTIVAVLLAGAQAAVQVAGSSAITTQGWITIVIAALGVVAVQVVPNKVTARPTP